MSIFEKLKNGESADMKSEEYRPAIAKDVPATAVVGGNPAKVIRKPDVPEP